MLISKRMKIDISIISICIMLVSFFIFFTNPENLPVIMILILPVLSVIASYIITNIIITWLFGLSRKYSSAISAGLSIFVLSVFLLGSVKQLIAQDLLLISLFVLGVMFYTLRLKAFSN